MIRAALRGDDPFAALAEQLDRLPDEHDRYRRMLAPNWIPDQMEVPNGSVWGCLAQAVWAVRTTTTFAHALIAAIELGGDTDTVAAVAGGLAGAVLGVQAIPSRWTTYVHGRVTTSHGVRDYDADDLQKLALRLIGKQPAMMAGLGPGVGPTEIAPGLYAADLTAAAASPDDHAVISLCRTDGMLDDHPYRRSVFLIDQVGANADLAFVAADTVATIDAFLAEGRTVLVHCHHGQSRTGFILRAWLMHHHDWDEATATEELTTRWPHLRPTTTPTSPCSCATGGPPRRSAEPGPAPHFEVWLCASDGKRTSCAANTSAMTAAIAGLEPGRNGVLRNEPSP